ncbi:MAG: hypothetical protein V1871_04985 [Planctomycetota bacterium]
MKIFSLSFLLLFLFFTAQIYATPEMDSVKIGWGEEGYYRLGYFTPAQIRLKSDTDFEGLITITIDNLSYSKDFQLSKNDTANIEFNVLILSDQPSIEITIRENNKTPVNKYYFSRQLQNVHKDEFLIAVEKSCLDIFQSNFTGKYPDAARKSKFVSFQKEELPNESISYESLDLIALPDANLPPSIQNALYSWATDMNGIVLYKLGDAENIPQLFKTKKNPYSENPCINSGIYRKVTYQLIPPSERKTLSDYILIYSIITVIIFFLLLPLKNTKKMVATIFSVISIAIFLFYAFYLPRNPIVEMNDFGQTNGLFMRILDYSAKNDIVLERKKEDAFIIKPIYRDTKSMTHTKIHYHSGYALQSATHNTNEELKDTIRIEFPNNSQDKTFIFQVYTVRK